MFIDFLPFDEQNWIFYFIKQRGKCPFKCPINPVFKTVDLDTVFLKPAKSCPLQSGDLSLGSKAKHPYKHLLT